MTPTQNDHRGGSERSPLRPAFGYAEALAEVSGQLRAAELARREAERARRRAQREQRSALLDERGLALI
jgi:hypothetical protein